MKVVATSVAGNFYNAADWVNKYDLGQYLKQFDFTGGNTLIVLVMPEEKRQELLKRKVIR